MSVITHVLDDSAANKWLHCWLLSQNCPFFLGFSMEKVPLLNFQMKTGPVAQYLQGLLLHNIKSMEKRLHTLKKGNMSRVTFRHRTTCAVMFWHVQEPN